MIRSRGDRAEDPELRKIACVEWHDAEVGAIILQAHDPSVIEFTHLPVYRELHAEKFEIWSYRASLQLFGVRKVLIEGEGEDPDYISDAIASGDNGVFTSGMLPINEQVGVDRIEVVFGSGRKLELQCRYVQLVLREAIKHVEDWDGPLNSPNKR
jgi:hypothetical protein